MESIEQLKEMVNRFHEQTGKSLGTPHAGELLNQAGNWLQTIQVCERLDKIIELLEDQVG